MTEKERCSHTVAHFAAVRIDHMSDTNEFMADVSIKCEKCGHPFQFIGLPLGLNMRGAAMSVDGQTARLAIAPVGWEPHPLGIGPTGFGVKAS